LRLVAAFCRVAPPAHHGFLDLPVYLDHLPTREQVLEEKRAAAKWPPLSPEVMPLP
jgi:hypothetical protein